MSFLLDFIDFNKGLDFQIVGLAIGVYFLLLWVILCVWVIKDATARYNSTISAILWGVAVFIFNLPALILFLVVRPDKLDIVDGNADRITSDTVAIPVADFVNSDNEIVLGVQIKINPKTLTASSRTLNVAVDWDGQSGGNDRQEMEISAKRAAGGVVVEEVVTTTRTRSQLFKSLPKKLSALLRKPNKSVKIDEPILAVEESSIATEQHEMSTTTQQEGAVVPVMDGSEVAVEVEAVQQSRRNRNKRRNRR